jgi:hypothetical protein
MFQSRAAHLSSLIGFVLLLLPAASSAQSAGAASDSPVPKAAPATRWLKGTGQGPKVSGLVYSVAGWTMRDENAAPAVDDRPLMSLHRGRLWLRGKPHARLSYMLHFGFDRMGADEYALLQGSALSTARVPALLDARAQFQALSGGLLTLTAGFFRPAVGSENNAVVFAASSHEPALTAVLARRGSAGAGHGRAAGLNLGGRWRRGALGVVYQLGLSMPTASGALASGATYDSSMGAKVSPLMATTLALTWGADPFRGGHMVHLTNTYNGKLSLALGASASQQGATDLATRSEVITAFALAHLGGLNLDGEWVQAERASTAGGKDARTVARHLRAGYNWPLLGDKTLLEPSLLWTEMDGDETLSGAAAMKLFSGRGRLIDAALNLHLRAHKMRVSAHWIQATSERSGSLPVREGQTVLVGLQVQH